MVFYALSNFTILLLGTLAPTLFLSSFALLISGRNGDRLQSYP